MQVTNFGDKNEAGLIQSIRSIEDSPSIFEM